MVVCRFFQQGRCKFGNDCRNEHVGSRGYDESSYLPQNDRYHFVKEQTSQSVNTDPKQHTSQILEIVRQDLTAAEKGGQWPFSCYAPVKEYGIINGLEDVSPEELRWQMYSSRESGKIEECNRIFQEMLQTIRLRWSILQSSYSVEAQSIIQSIFQQEGTPGSFSSNSPLFGEPEKYTSSIFGGTAVSPSTNPSQSLNQISSIFGGPTNVLPPTGLFAAAAASQNSNPLFTQPSTSQPPTGFFGAAAAAVTNQSQQGSLFGGSFAQPSGIFGTPTSASVFGGSPILPSTNVFGRSNQDSSVFGSVKQTGENQGFGTFNNSQSSSLFPSMPVSVSTEIGVGGAAANTLYSAMSDLSEEIKSTFKAQTFVMGKVPTKPPPRELCF